MLEDLICTYSNPGDSVLDFTMGVVQRVLHASRRGDVLLVLKRTGITFLWRKQRLERSRKVGDMNRALCGVIIVLLVACGALWLATDHYRDNAITYKVQRDKKVRELKLADATITDMQQRQRDVAALAKLHTKELADARAENETLRADVAAGRRSLRVNATCVSATDKATGTARVGDNAARPNWQTPLNGIISPSENG